MKTIVATIAAAIILAAISPASAENKCVRSRDIESTNSKDGKLLIMRMRDGSVLVNHLQGVCSDLRFEGFVWVLRGGDESICENQQSLKVLRSGQTCVLGKFDVVKDKPVKN